jgi:hypothetical protein
MRMPEIRGGVEGKARGKGVFVRGLKGAVAICNHDDCIHIAFIACSDHWPGSERYRHEKESNCSHGDEKKTSSDRGRRVLV